MYAEKKEFDNELEMIRDFMRLRKKYYRGEENETFWRDMLDTCNRLDRKYSNDFLKQLILVHVGDVEYRNRKEHGWRVNGDQLGVLYERLKERMS